jgi:hypothetical protein
MGPRHHLDPALARDFEPAPDVPVGDLSHDSLAARGFHVAVIEFGPARACLGGKRGRDKHREQQ